MFPMPKLSDVSGLAWTLVGTGLVLITLTGDTRRWGLIMAGAGLIINIIALFGDRESE
jgi:energy-converting hydrogenase Eha subunit G